MFSPLPCAQRVGSFLLLRLRVGWTPTVFTWRVVSPTPTDAPSAAADPVACASPAATSNEDTWQYGWRCERCALSQSIKGSALFSFKRRRGILLIEHWNVGWMRGRVMAKGVVGEASIIGCEASMHTTRKRKFRIRDPTTPSCLVYVLYVCTMYYVLCTLLSTTYILHTTIGNTCTF